MNKDLVLNRMVDSFKKANVELAIVSGVEKASAESQIEVMDESIKKCMEKVLEDLVENFPDIQNSVG
jgi:hypothetical protein